MPSIQTVGINFGKGFRSFHIQTHVAGLGSELLLRPRGARIHYEQSLAKPRHSHAARSALNLGLVGKVVNQCILFPNIVLTSRRIASLGRRQAFRGGQRGRAAQVVCEYQCIEQINKAEMIATVRSHIHRRQTQPELSETCSSNSMSRPRNKVTHHLPPSSVPRGMTRERRLRPTALRRGRPAFTHGWRSAAPAASSMAA